MKKEKRPAADPLQSPPHSHKKPPGNRKKALLSGGNEDIQRLLQELQNHQIELEIQNKELRQAQVELEAAKERYIDLYEHAPVGYLTLDEKGLIQEANLTAAILLGVRRSALVKRPFIRFIFRDDQDIFYLLGRQLREQSGPQACELRLKRPIGSQFWVRLEATGIHEVTGEYFTRVVISDISESKLKEDQREQTARLIQLVNAPGDLHECISALTSSMRNWSGCEAVGVRLRDGDDYPYYETSGFTEEFVLLESHLCLYGPDGQIILDGEGNPLLECMCGNILSGRFDPSKPFFTPRGSFWTNSTTALLAGTSESERQSRTRNRCNGEGYESVALIPMRVGDRVLGLVQLNDHRPNRFTLSLISRFEEMADSLALAISRRLAEEALRLQEMRYRAVVEDQTEVISRIWSDGRIIFVNDVYCRFFGKTVEELLGNDWQPAVVTEDLPVIEEKLALLSPLNPVVTIENRVVAGDGKIHWMQFVNRGFFDEDGRLVEIQSVGRDITERKQAEEALRESEERYRKLFETETDAIILLDQETLHILQVNPAALKMYGYSQEEFLQLGALDISAEPEKTREAIASKHYTIDYRLHRKKDGTLISVEISASTFESKGRGVHVAAIRDISERKRAEYEIARLASFPMLNPQPIMEVDMDGRVSFVNEAARRLFPDLEAEGSGHPWLTNWEQLVTSCRDNRIKPDNREVAVAGRWYYQCMYYVPQEERLRIYGFDITPHKQIGEALRLAGIYNRSLIEASLDPLVTIGPDGKITDVNAATEKITGRPRSELVKTDFCDYFTDPDHARTGYQKAFREGSVRDYPLELRHRDGSVTSVLYNASVYRDEKGDVIGVFAAARDITERIKAEEALRESEERYRKLFETETDAILLLDRETDYFLDANPAALKMYGYSLDEFLRLTSADISAEPVKTRQAIAANHMYVPNRLHRKKDGTLFAVEIAGSYFEYHGRDVHVAAIRDISERLRAEEALRESEERLQLALASSSMGVWEWDLFTGNVYRSAECIAIDGIPGADWTYESFKKLLHPDDAERVAAILDRAVAEKSLYRAEYRIVRPYGEVRWIADLGRVVCNKDGIPVRVLGTVQDITKRKQWEEKVISYQKQLRSMASELSLVEERERRKIATALHDQIGQTLAMAVFKLGELRQAAVQEDMERDIDKVRGMISEAIRSSRALTFELSPPILYDLGLEAAISSLAENYQKDHGIRIDCRDDRKPKELSFDMSILLFQGVRELLVNAVKHAHPSRITISCMREATEVRVVVEDDGVGFTPATANEGELTEKAHCFGLFSLRERFRHAGGKITINSALGRGTQITLTAPLASEPNSQE